jgi:hypothetical protein
MRAPQWDSLYADWWRESPVKEAESTKWNSIKEENLLSVRRNTSLARHRWLVPATLATQEAEIRRFETGLGK